MALVFVRKLLDFFFSKRELSYLDDIMPESKRKREDDKKKEAQEKLVGVDLGSFPDHIAGKVSDPWVLFYLFSG